MKSTLSSALNTNSSVVVAHCQICDNDQLEPVLFLGYLPPVNKMVKTGTRPHEQPAYPAELLYCQKCNLTQLGLIVDPNILFPPEYPYTSSTTKILRENFAELYTDCQKYIKLSPEDLIVDIGSNDGNLLSNFMKNHKVLGVTPEQIGKLAIERGIPTIISFFNNEVVEKIKKANGQARIITATNVFAHMEKIHDVVQNIRSLLKADGTFISESHYLLPLVETLQYDTIYHEHMRYYSLHSLKYLLEMNGFEVYHAKKIPTHGGSIRVYAAAKGLKPIQASVEEILAEERKSIIGADKLRKFRHDVILSKLKLNSMLLDIKNKNQKVYGISAPSRASTLINYVGLDDGTVDYVLEVKGSHKIGNYIPGTIIPIEEEARLYADQPEYALLLSWHIADELVPKIREKGFEGKFIIPLPEPKIV